MKRAWHTWFVFLFCVIVLLSAMGWVSAMVVHLEKRNVESQQRAAVEEVVRLALWRMDSAASAIIVEESARPYFEYSSYNPWEALPNGAILQNSLNADGFVPSRLLTENPSNSLVYFNVNVDAASSDLKITSPQVPEGDFRQLTLDNRFQKEEQLSINVGNLKRFNDNVNAVDLASALNVPLPQQGAAQDAPAAQAAEPMQMAQVGLNQDGSARAPVPSQSRQVVQQRTVNQTIELSNQQMPVAPQIDQHGNAADVEDQQFYGGRNYQEWSARKGQVARIQSKAGRSKQSLYSSIKKAVRPSRAIAADQFGSPSRYVQQVEQVELQPPAYASDISEDVMRPLWVNNVLVLARQVTIDGARSIQGVWLNWDLIEEDLLGEIQDILPEARLEPANENDVVATGRHMASLPVRLVPGPPAVAAVIVGNPLSLPLAVAWAGVLVASLAVGIVLFGAIALSERRAAFVSAGTHELRTPLTTFQMYAEMLEKGMVTDPDQQQKYLATLRAEGERLKHLVENVLSYSRIERGRASGHPQSITLGEIADRSRDRLQQRAEQAGMCVEVSCNGDEAAIVNADPSMIEQILFNLVDNACKYAGKAEDRRIHVDSRARPRSVSIRVRDHGPGIDRGESRKLFRPFHKSANTAAETAPGVGLGLSLSRRLARRMGGDLRIDTACNGGACFELMLPRAG